MLTTLSKLNLTRLFLIAILLRILIMPFFFHPDIKTYHYQASFLKKGVFNIYVFLINNRSELPLKEEFVYSPLAYFFLGFYQMIVSPLLGPNFNNWLSDASVQSIESVGTFRYLFILKLPYLFCDLIIAFLLTYFFKDLKQKKKIFILWLFNPFSIILIYFFSNIDIVPVTLSLISLLLFKNRKIFFSALFLGLAAGFKTYPFLFLPFFLLYTYKLRNLLKMVVVSLGVFILIALPFWSDAFLKSSLISGLTTRMMFPNIELGFGESLMVSITGLSALFVAGLVEKGKKEENIWLCIMLFLLLFFSSIHYHIQWLLWITPFLLTFYVFEERLGKISLLWLGLGFIVPFLYDDKSMSVSLLSAISPLYNQLPTPFFVLQHLYDPFILQGVIHSLMLGVSLILVIRSFKFLRYG